MFYLDFIGTNSGDRTNQHNSSSSGSDSWVVRTSISDKPKSLTYACFLCEGRCSASSVPFCCTVNTKTSAWVSWTKWSKLVINPRDASIARVFCFVFLYCTSKYIYITSTSASVIISWGWGELFQTKPNPSTVIARVVKCFCSRQWRDWPVLPVVQGNRLTALTGFNWPKKTLFCSKTDYSYGTIDACWVSYKRC